MIRQLTLGAAIAAFLATPVHAQGWAQALTALGAFSQGVQNGEAQRYNMEHGYPAYVAPPYGSQSPGPSYFILNGRIITCLPMGNGSTYCQ